MFCFTKTKTFVFFLSLSVSSMAAQRVVLHRLPLSALEQMVPLETQTSSAHRQEALESLTLIDEHTDAYHVTHRRMQQLYSGFPVHGGEVIVHQAASPTSPLKKAVSTGVLYRDLMAELGPVPVDFRENAQRVLEKFKSQYPQASLRTSNVVPMVYINHTLHAVWAYRVAVLLESPTLTKRPAAIIDARTHARLFEWDDLKAEHAAVKGMGYGGNPRTGLFVYGKTHPLLEITRDTPQQQCSMENKGVRVFDMKNRTLFPSNVMTFECASSTPSHHNVYWTGYGGDGYDQKNGAYSVANDALYIGTMVKNMYRSWYNVDVLQRASHPIPLDMCVHYGQYYENAYWDGQRMIFGDGDTMMYPLVSLGVGAHEITHGFTEQHARLVYHGQAGGLDESFSDMAAQAAEYYVNQKNTWKIGADILKEGSGVSALRFMDQPSRDGRSIDRANQYKPGMDVHYSSGVYNHLFYLLSTQTGWTPKKTFEIMLKANMDYWTPTTTFDEASCGVLAAASDIGVPTHEITWALDEVGVHYEQC